MVPISILVDCGSRICILSNKVFECVGLNDTLGRVGSKVGGVDSSQLDILGTMELDTALKGRKAKQIFHICDNFMQSALLGVDVLRDNGCVVDLSKGILHAGNKEVKLRDQSSWVIHEVSLVETVTIQPDRKVDLMCRPLTTVRTKRRWMKRLIGKVFRIQFHRQYK